MVQVSKVAGKLWRLHVTVTFSYFCLHSIFSRLCEMCVSSLKDLEKAVLIAWTMHTSKTSQNFLLNAPFDEETSKNLLRVRIRWSWLVRMFIFFFCSIVRLHFDWLNLAKKFCTSPPKRPNRCPSRSMMTLCTEIFWKILHSATRPMHRIWFVSFWVCASTSQNLQS